VGYDLHITRAGNWLDAQAQPIGRDEWNSYAGQHAALVEAGWTDWADVGRQPVYELTGRDEEGPALGWHRGEVNVSGETIEYLPELVAIAADLHANVVGDDGENYTAEGPVGVIADI